MSTLGQLVSNSVWFAFDALDYQKCGAVPKSQLKVLTQNISVLLSIDRRVENCISDFMSYEQLSYEQYLYFLTHEVFAEVDNGKKSYSKLRGYHDTLEQAFWVLGRPSLLKRHQPILSHDSVFKLFRIFCLLGDREQGALTQVTVPRGEVDDITRSLIIELGREFDVEDFQEVSKMIPSFTLPILLTFLEGRYLQDTEAPALEAAVEELYQSFVEQVLEKDRMFQRFSWAPIWIYRDLELVPWEIRPTRNRTCMDSDKVTANPLLVLNPQCTVHGIQDSPGAKPCRINICLDNNKILQLAAADHRTKTRWLRSLEEAINNSEEPLPLQMMLSEARKEDRALEEEKRIEEKIRRASQADIIEQTQAELVQERLARADAEAQAREQSAARAAEGRRVQELLTLRKELEHLLEQETRAKRDEEIVRNLQARVLREEWDKREELELLQKEQNIILEAEKKKREAFELVQDEKESQLKEAQKLLRKLEIERMKLDHELRTAREIIVMSERGKEVVEARMKVKERTPPARTYSLRPVKREERTAPMRSSSFNTHSSRKLKKLSELSQQDEHPSEDDIDSNNEVLIKSSCESLNQKASSNSNDERRHKNESINTKQINGDQDQKVLLINLEDYDSQIDIDPDEKLTNFDNTSEKETLKLPISDL